MKIFKKNFAQTYVEYSLLLGIVVMIMMAMSPLVRRSSQGLVRLVADQVGNQLDAEPSTGRYGRIINSQTIARADQFKRQLLDPDVVTYESSDRTFTQLDQLMNMGYSSGTK